ncbi:hypothetical protein PS691_01966 [Pseudomonas fluorescens]|uniref:Uncharacterized protein n=1 Tax=Pseudomonas fluorescens TaxID=294 RepID=A0A5E7BLK8_PSEFL|nr:hypothetical protein PS691_01966 [Pseudomonas fluorescens]
MPCGSALVPIIWPGPHQGSQLELSSEQFQALVIGLPWQRLGSDRIFRML